MAKLNPTYIFERVEEIPFSILEENNIKGILFDVDNTLIDVSGELIKEKYEWIMEAKKRGYKICILSNSFQMTKIKRLSKELDIFGLGLACKPLLKGFKMAECILDMDREEMIMVGDQLFTDIYGANRFGIKSILVSPINEKEGFITKIKRPLESIIIKKYKKEGK